MLCTPSLNSEWIINEFIFLMECHFSDFVDAWCCAGILVLINIKEGLTMKENVRMRGTFSCYFSLNVMAFY